MDATAHSHDPTPPHPLGLIGSEPEALAIARRLADTGHRILHSILPPAAALPRAANLEPADAPFDIAAACKVIALCIDDTERLRRLLFGDKDRTGLAADVAAGSVFIDFGIRPPREAQSMIGLLGMRGIGLVDCALLGSHAAIAGGTASVLAGGFPDPVAQSGTGDTQALAFSGRAFHRLPNGRDYGGALHREIRALRRHRCAPPRRVSRRPATRRPSRSSARGSPSARLAPQRRSRG